MPIEERRRRLIEAAISVVADLGVASATTRAIAGRAEMPLASFHYAFASHQELMLATLHTLIEAELTEFNGLTMQGEHLDACLTHGLGEHLDDVVARTPSYRSLAELSLYVSHLPGHSDLPLRYRRRRTERAVGKLQGVVDAVGNPDDVDLHMVASTLIVAADGITMAVLNGVDPDEVRSTFPSLVRTS